MRINILGLRLQFKCKKDARPKHYGFKKFLDFEASNKLLKEKILSGKPFALGRTGGVEMPVIFSYYRQRGKKNVHFNPDQISRIKTNAGFFSADDKQLARYSKEIISFLHNFDILVPCLFYYHHEETLFKYYASDNCFYADADTILFNPQILLNCDSPWTEALEGKKVLVIHPFKETILQQSIKRKLLFKNPKLAPDCEIKVIKAVQGIDTENALKKYGDWFNALESMYREIDKEDFDIAIIGAGAFALFLANYVKIKGKQAITLCGATQFLFGIKGSRWDSLNIYNEHWINVLPQDKVENLEAFIKVEGSSAYW